MPDWLILVLLLAFAYGGIDLLLLGVVRAAEWRQRRPRTKGTNIHREN